MKLNNKGYAITIIVFGILIIFVIVLGSLLVTMNNTVKINKVVKEDVIENIQLGADTSGMSLTERIEQLEYKLSKVDGNIIDTIYPVGSIYITATDSSIDLVKQKFPETEWEVYAQGRTLIGVGSTTDTNNNALVYDKVNIQGGSAITTLGVSNLPKHSHNYNKSSNVTESTTLTIAQIPSHRHMLNSNGGNLGYYDGSGENVASNYVYTIGWGKNTSRTDVYVTSGNEGGGQGHTHGISNTSTASSETGSGSSFSVQNPYITVYMYKRIK